VVLDISLDANRGAVERLLARGVRVEYFDHHYAGASPPPSALVGHLDGAPDVCTGIIVDRHLRGTQRIWAVVAALGDNLQDAARALAATLALNEPDLGLLQRLADCMTYNAYGDRPEDAIVAPETLYRALLAAREPREFVRDDPLFVQIDRARQQDMANASALTPTHRLRGALVYILPDAPWARRIRGILGNELARGQPSLAHAILTPDVDGDFVASVRAPRSRPVGADALCRQFSSGGGRMGAAGIGRLPPADLPRFLACLDAAYPGPS